ncbi:MAG: hypothetical protein AAFY88_01725 [Acidobacteriota bacterium]
MHAVAVLSSHFHLLCSFDSVEQMASFMCQLKTNLSKEIGRIYGREGPLFAGRYRSIPLSDEPEVQVERLEYILSQGTKEGLVLTPKDWPGVHSARALLDDEPIRGVWVDRTGLYAARQRAEDVTEMHFTEQTELHLAPLPCYKSLSIPERKKSICDLVDRIEARALHRHREQGTVPLGVAAVLSCDPHGRPRELSKSPKPHFHASKAAFKAMMEAFRVFVLAYRHAAGRLAEGHREVEFPDNCFPPRLPFVAPIADSSHQTLAITASP